MKKLGFGLALLLIGLTAAAAEDTVYGEGVKVAEAVPILKVLTHPERYTGKTIRVAGRIGDVCPRKGCWIDVQDAEERTLRFKVEDDVIVFPLSTMGMQVDVEGVLTRIELDHDASVRYMRHLAEEKSEPFDPSSVTGPMTIYQIEGTGAVVRGSDGT